MTSFICLIFSSFWFCVCTLVDVSFVTIHHGICMSDFLELCSMFAPPLCQCLLLYSVCFPYSWQNHNLTTKYDFHSYMVRSMEEEFQRIVGVRLVEIQKSFLLQLHEFGSQFLFIYYNKISCALLCIVHDLNFQGDCVLINWTKIINSFTFSVLRGSSTFLFLIAKITNYIVTAFVFHKLILMKKLKAYSVCKIFCSGPLWGFVVAFMLFNIKGIAYC